MFLRIAFVILLPAARLLAADSTIIPVPPGLQQLSPKQFNDLLSKSLAGPTVRELDGHHIARLTPEKCSIPLQTFHAVDHDPAFSRRIPRLGKTVDPMAIAPPAPPCR